MKISTVLFYRLVLLLSWGALTAGLIAHYGFGIKPCILCIYERYIYVALGFIAFLALRDLFPRSWIALLMGATLSAGILLGAYHFGIEQHWWQGTEKCGSGSLKATTIEGLRQQIMQTTPRCDQIDWRVFGLPATFWNIVLLTGQLLLGILVWRHRASHHAKR
jgi:disulfide bond formation protein DsbB